jgi:hypothetical protein
MTEEIKAYCMKCKAERSIQNVQIVTTKNGRPAANGACPVCGTKMFKFLPSSYKAMAAPMAEAAPAAPASEPPAEPAPEQPAA